jgi:hypothetical protein
VYISHYIECLIKELGIDNSLGNPTYTLRALTKEEILDNHRSVLCSLGISTKDGELDLGVLQKPHLIHPSPGVASVTLNLKPGFDRR